LRADDSDILNSVKNTLNCGYITFSNDTINQARFSVQNAKELATIIIPFFKKYPLRAKKREDFKLWSEAVKILDKYRDGVLNIEKGHRGFVKKGIDEGDTKRLQEIRNEMSEYKSKRSRDFKWGT